ncbi:MAG: hypothetical protein H8E66_32735 [Planctomycetes bacterium]|nr:hypothetical protein [Planctomycetota bacterium]
MQNKICSLLTVLLLATAYVPTARGNFFEMITERTETQRSGTKADPTITETWEDLASNGIGTSHLIYESTYYGRANWGDTRDFYGEGKVWYESQDEDKIKEWQWTNGFQSGSEKVLTTFSGYYLYYKSVDKSNLFGLVDTDEKIQDLWYMNATEASFLVPWLMRLWR